MPSVADIDLDAPGLAFSSLLRLANPKRIKTLLPNEILEVMDGLEPGFSDSGKLTELAVKMLDSAATLQDDTLRSEIISLMPLKKARELCSKLCSLEGRNPFDELTNDCLFHTNGLGMRLTYVDERHSRRGTSGRHLLPAKHSR